MNDNELFISEIKKRPITIYFNESVPGGYSDYIREKIVHIVRKITGTMLQIGSEVYIINRYLVIGISRLHCSTRDVPVLYTYSYGHKICDSDQLYCLSNEEIVLNVTIDTYIQELEKVVKSLVNQLLEVEIL